MGYNNLGVLLSGQGRKAEAAEMFRAALKREPRSFTALLGLGATLAASQKYSEAAAVSGKSLEGSPGIAGDLWRGAAALSGSSFSRNRDRLPRRVRIRRRRDEKRKSKVEGQKPAVPGKPRHTLQRMAQGRRRPPLQRAHLKVDATGGPYVEGRRRRKQAISGGHLKRRGTSTLPMPRLT